MMKSLCLLTIAAVAIFATPAAAWTPEGTRCITSVGYTTGDWEAIHVPRGPADKIRACLARVNATYDKKRGQ
jgi:hypothetical protein